MSGPRWLLPLLALAAAPAAVLGSLAWGFDPVEASARAPLIHREGGHAGSDACRACHADHHESWRRTFHRTMTQLATSESVAGGFDGRSVPWLGKGGRPFARDGRYFMEVPDGEGTRTAAVALTVGSRRYQQYFERVPRGAGFAFLRLPLLWHIEQQRWMHLNSVFLGPDDADWGRHAAEWNENCVFCHNTAPEPRMLDHDSRARTGAEQFDSKVAELGIACEACHGPGAEHVRQEQDPWRRYARRLGAGRAPAIVHPGKIAPARSIAVCGQCHGQKLPEPVTRIREWLTTGPTFEAGDALEEHVRPIFQDTDPPGSKGASDLFALRFWGDGTPRLTAYELQGVLLSPCAQRGEMTCLSCHAMHDGDPRGQLRPDRAGDAMCLSCHGRIGADVAAHTHHAAASAGSACVSCHMPRIVYGVTAVHRSHRIESPDARRDAEAGRPHACTLCHLDRSLAWSAAEIARLWGKPARVPAERRDRAPLALPDGIASLHAGDPVARVVYADAMGREGAARARLALRTHLAIAMGDGYPSVRRTAHASFRALDTHCGASLAGIDPLAGGDARPALVAAALAAARACPSPDPSADAFVDAAGEPRIQDITRLLDLQDEHVIAIGE